VVKERIGELANIITVATAITGIIKLAVKMAKGKPHTRKRRRSKKRK
jgi:hypothetical protein